MRNSSQVEGAAGWVISREERHDQRESTVRRIRLGRLARAAPGTDPASRVAVGGSCQAGHVPKTQYFTATSIDGFIADADNSLDWLFQASSMTAEAVREDQFSQFFGAIGAMAMGATTYEWVVEHERLLEQPGKWHEYYGDVRCWVFTHRPLPVIPGAGIIFVSGDVRPVHQEMTAAAGDRNIWLVGGGDLVGQFADHGLLDELLLSIAPATLGSGAPLLPRRLLPGELTLAECRPDGTFVHLRYAVAHPAS